MAKKVLGTALVKRLCPVCLKEQDSEILMNTVLTEKNADEIEAMHGKVVGFMDDACDECQEKLPKDKGTWLVVVDLSKTEDKSNPHRTGQLFGVRKEYALKIGVNSYISYIDYNDVIRLGFEINQ